MKYNSSIFSQILQCVDRVVFEKIVSKHGGEYDAKGFSCWYQLVGMLFCQFGQCKSLREISDGLASTCGKLNHLGLRKSPARSTISYANSHRPSEIYEDLFYSMLDKCKSLSYGKKKFRFKNKLYSLDASLIDLCLNMFDWAHYRRCKGAAKLHLVLDHDGYLPVFVSITDGKCHELNIAKDIIFPKGSIVAIDRGYCDYDLFAKWNRSKVYFVTKLKNNAAHKVVSRFGLPRHSNVISDEHIEFTGYTARKSYPDKLRKVVVLDEEQKQITLLTNNMSLSPVSIGQIYHQRWQIEIFFKTIKQNLKIKTFVGTSENAFKIQIWTALITLLLLKFIQFKSRCNWALCRLVALLRLNLFAYRDLWHFMKDPLDHSEISPPHQMTLMY